MKTIFDELKQEVKNWWVSLILGILYVAVALGLMFFPFNGYAALSILFSIPFVSLLYKLIKLWLQQNLRDKRVGLVYSIRHSCHRMLAYYPVATDGRSYLRRLYDFVCIPYHRILPYHALFRTEESAQTKFPELLIRHRLHRYVQIRYS